MDINKHNILTPAGFELTQEAEHHIRITSQSKILSLGCGRGELEAYLANKYGCYMLGLDINPDNIREARKHNLSNLEFRIGDAAALDFQNESFDFIFICGAFANFTRSVPAIHRILKNGGVAVLIEVVYRESVIPFKVIEKWSQRKDVDILKPVSAEQIEDIFFRWNFYKSFSKKVYDLDWWNLYFSAKAGNSDIKEEQEILNHYCSHIALGLYVFNKLTYISYDI